MRAAQQQCVQRESPYRRTIERAAYLFSNSKSASTFQQPGVMLRIFSAMIARSETVAVASFRLNILYFLRRCRRRLSSFLRSLIDTGYTPAKEPTLLQTRENSHGRKTRRLFLPRFPIGPGEH
jgi:hypothetical protein